MKDSKVNYLMSCGVSEWLRETYKYTLVKVKLFGSGGKCSYSLFRFEHVRMLFTGINCQDSFYQNYNALHRTCFSDLHLEYTVIPDITCPYKCFIQMMLMS